MAPLMRLVLGLGALLVILAATGLALPRQVTVARAVVINAAEPVVFPYLNSPKAFAGWSPWKQRDPDLQMTYSGPDQGKGARVDWTSEKASVGEGSVEISDSQPNRLIELVSSFNGLEGTSSFNVLPSGSGSKVVWSFEYETSTNPIRRWRGLMLDRLVGTEFDAGLAALKERVEAERGTYAPQPAPAPAATPAPDAGAGAAAVPPAPQPLPPVVQEQRRPRRP